MSDKKSASRTPPIFLALSHIGLTADHPLDGILESWPHMLRGTSLRTLGAVVATLVVACVIAASWAAPAGAVRPTGSHSPAVHMKVSKGAKISKVSPQSCANSDGDEEDGHRKSCGRDDEPQDHQNQSSSRPASSSPAAPPEPEASHTPKSSRTPKPATSSRAARSHRATSSPSVPPGTTQSGPPASAPSVTGGLSAGTVGGGFPAAGQPTTPALQVAPIDTVALQRPSGTATSGAASEPGAPATFPSASSASGVPLPRFVRLSERPLFGVDSPLLIGAEIAVFTLAVGAMVATAGHRGRRTH